MTKQKDPAFLFYPNDYLGGTLGMSFDQKGAYVDLLILQFNRGSFTGQQAINLIGAERWVEIQSKFDTDGSLYWKERLKNEIEKRVKFSKHQSENVNKRYQNSTKPPTKNLPLEIENENRNEDLIENKEKGSGEKPYQTPIEFLKETNPSKITELFYSSDFRNENRPDFDHFCGQWSLTVEKDGFEFIGDLDQEKKLLAGLTKYLRTVQHNQQNNPMMFKKHMGTMTGEKRSIEDGEKMIAQVAAEIEKELSEGK